MPSQEIEQQLRATGVVQLIAVIAPAKAASGGTDRGPADFRLTGADGVAAALRRSFLASSSSRNVALLSAGESLGGGHDVAGRPSSGETPGVSLYPHLGLMLGTVDLQGYRSLKDDKRLSALVAAPELSLIRPTHVEPAGRAKRCWGLARLRIPALWKVGLTGHGVLVGHLDTGVEVRHPALEGAVHKFAEFDALGRIIPKAKARDSEEHGTHTAGTIVGRKAGGRDIGVAPGSKLISGLVIEGGNTIARVLGGLDWAVSQRVRVVSLSLGVRGYRDDFLVVIRRLRRDLGILPVVAIGNDGPQTSRSPGNYPESLSVGALARNNTVPLFSSSQRLLKPERLVPKLVAPGQGVVSSVPGGGYASWSGTSMATPHLAGLAALLLEHSPTATPDQLESAILYACSRPGQVLEERAGRGVPDGPKALQRLKELV
jgi:subtilisin family serine protease